RSPDGRSWKLSVSAIGNRDGHSGIRPHPARAGAAQSQGQIAAHRLPQLPWKFVLFPCLALAVRKAWFSIEYRLRKRNVCCVEGNGSLGLRGGMVASEPRRR